MKKVYILILSALLCLGLCACGNKSSDEKKSNKTYMAMLKMPNGDIVEGIATYPLAQGSELIYTIYIDGLLYRTDPENLVIYEVR